MKFSRELIEKAKEAKTVEELLDIAKGENVELTAENAAKLYADLHTSGELSDEELDNVSGGCGDDDKSGDTPKYKVGDKVSYKKYVPSTRGYPIQKKVDVRVIAVLDKVDGYFTYKVTGGLTMKENELYS